MKICPFCKEQVHEEAIKCRYCQSMLLAPQLPEPKQPEDGRVTYILDQDLVRFGKFAAAVLAIFLVFGGYLFGFKLEAGLERVQSSAWAAPSDGSALRRAGGGRRHDDRAG